MGKILLALLLSTVISFGVDNYSKILSKMLKQGQSVNATAKDLSMVGEMYRTGAGVEKDIVKSLKYYKKAADKGDIDSQFTLGILYGEDKGVKQDYKKSFLYFEQAAKQGDVEAQANIGVMYMYGYGVKQDKIKAYQWYMKAAKQGFKTAQENLDLLCKNSPWACK